MSEFDRAAGGVPSFRKAVPGERPSAGEWNKVTRALEVLLRHASPFLRHIGLEIVRLDQTLGPSQDISTDSITRDGFVQYWDKSVQTYLENANEKKTQITDPMEIVWDVDEMVPMFFHRQSGHYIPLNPRTTRHAITWVDVDGSYPARPANKYPIKFVRFEYDDTGAKLQTPTIVYLDSQSTAPASSDPDDYVLNIQDATGEIFLERLSPIWCYNVIGKNGQQQWYTYTCCGGDESSGGSSGSSGGLSSTTDLDLSSTTQLASSEQSSDQSSTTQDVSSTTQEVSSDISSEASSGQYSCELAASCYCVFTGGTWVEYDEPGEPPLYTCAEAAAIAGCGPYVCNCGPCSSIEEPFEGQLCQSNCVRA